MPPIFNARADYTAARDVRDHSELVELLASPPQKGVLYPLIAARRAGKTWELRALEHILKGRSGSTTRYVDLKKRKTDLSDVQPADCLLLDEPELTGQGKRVRSAEDFLHGCMEQHQRGTTLLLAMSPAEWMLLHQAGHEQELVSEKDLRFLSPLDEAQAQRLATRGEQATRLLPRLPETWKRNPFLLELVFQVAEEKGSDAEEDLWELLRLVRERSDDGEFRYFDAVYQNGLTDEQRATVKKVACSISTDKQSLMLVERCGLVGRREKRPVSEFGGEQEKDPVRDALWELVDRLRRQAMEKPESERAEELRQHVSRIDPGLVHGDDLERVRQERWTQPVRVAVLHHPVSSLPATELSRYVGLINAGEIKDRLLQSGFSLVLHGHAHTGWFGKEEWPGRHDNRALWIAAAPSLGSKEVQEHNGFNELQIAREPNEGEATYLITVRRDAREGGSWVEKAQLECKPVAH